MDIIDYIKVGKIVNSYGAEGWVKVTIYDDFTEFVDEATFIFILQENIPVPYRIIGRKTDRPMFKFDDIDNIDDADELRHKGMYLRADVIPDDKQVDSHPLIGYSINDKTLGLIGLIEDIIIMPHQELAQLVYKGKKRMIPLHSSLITDKDKINQTLEMDLPDGILDL